MKTLSPCDFEAPLVGGKTRLRAKMLADAKRDYQWQTDPETAYLDATEPLNIPFSRYFTEYREILSHPSPLRRFFAIETFSGEHIGNCTYYGIDREKDEAELGIMIGRREYRGKGYGADAVNTMLGYIFKQTGLKSIKLKTLTGNLQAQKCFLKCGFAALGEKTVEGYHFLLMEIDRDRWLKQGKNSTTDAGGPANRAYRE